jgi:hypothetical protein
VADALVVQKQVVLDILETPGTPALSSTSDVPVVETKPDAQNEGAPPAVPAKKEEVAPEAEAEQPGESATPATEEHPGQPAEEGKTPRGVGKALAELRQQRREAEAKTAAAEERLNKALEALEIYSGRREPEDTDPEPVKPARHEYPDPDTWDNAMVEFADKKAAWTARREVEAIRAEDQSKAQEAAIVASQTAAREAYAARMEKARAKYADFEEVAQSPDVQVSVPMAHAIIHSENGPDIQHYLGSHPEEAARIMKLSAPLQLLELGRLEERIMSPAPKQPVSAAPKPIKPIPPSSEPATKSADDMSMDEYAANRRKQEGWGDPQRPRTRH